MIQEAADRDMRASAVTVQKLMPKIFTHFANALRALQELEGTTIEIQSCQDAWILATKQAEIIHEMSKVNKYLLITVALVTRLGGITVAWTEKEREVWVAMEREVSDWVQDVTAHAECRAQRRQCFGV